MGSRFSHGAVAAGLSSLDSVASGGGGGGGGATWTSLADIDLTGADVAGPWTTGTQDVQHSAVTSIQVVVTRNASNTGNVSTGASGVTVQGTSNNGSMACSLLIGAESSEALAAASWVDGPVAVQVVCSSLTYAGTSPGVIVVASTGDDALQTGDRGIRLVKNGANQDRKTRKDTTDTAWIAAEAQTASFVSTTIIYAGRACYTEFATGTTPADPDTENARNIGDSVGAGGAALFSTDIRVPLVLIHGSSVIIERVRLLRLE